MTDHDYNGRWARFEAGMRDAGLGKVVSDMETHFQFGGDTGSSFEQMLEGHITRLFNEKENTHYWAPELVLGWVKQTRKMAELEIYRAANARMSVVLKEKVDAGTMSDADAVRFAQESANPILKHLLESK